MAERGGPGARLVHGLEGLERCGESSPGQSPQGLDLVSCLRFAIPFPTGSLRFWRGGVTRTPSNRSDRDVDLLAWWR